MSMTASVGGGMDFPECPTGLHPAVCYKLVDIGTQPNEKYPEKRQIILGFEIPGEMVEYTKDGETNEVPQTVSKFLTLSMHEKSNLRKIVQSWTGRVLSDADAAEYDLSRMLGQAAYINVIHKPNGKATIETVMALPNGLEVPEQINDTVYYSIDEHGLDWPACLSEKMIAWISKSSEIRALKGDAAVDAATKLPDPEPVDPASVPF